MTWLSLVSIKKFFFYPISFYFPQSHTWPDLGGHLWAPTVELRYIFGRFGCLYRILYKEQCSSGTPAVEPHHATWDVVLSGELKSPAGSILF